MRIERDHRTLLTVVFSILLSIATICANASRAEDGLQQVDVFQSGTEGYHTYRIPGVVLTNNNTLLALCEGRKTGRSDHGDLDLMLRRSFAGSARNTPIGL